MKFMKLGSRPDTFFTSESVRSISSEVPTDIKIRVQNFVYLLHKFPLLSKCGRLQSLCADSGDDSVVELPGFPGSADAFEACVKFCYGIAITVSAANIVPIRCAAEYLQMSEEIDRSNLAGKLDTFFASCILRRWKDTIVALRCSRQYASLCDELAITYRCIDTIASMIAQQNNPSNNPVRSQWAEDIADFGIDMYWRIMVAVKSAGLVPSKAIGNSVKAYVRRWLPNLLSLDLQQPSSSESTTKKHRFLLEKMVNLLPPEKGSVSCSFLLKLLKAANILSASASTKIELTRRIGAQLEEASVADLLIPSTSNPTSFDVDLVMAIVSEFMLRAQSPPTSPLPTERLRAVQQRRSRSAGDVDFELENDLQHAGRKSSSASHSAKLRVAKLVDGYLQEIAGDPNLRLEKLLAIVEAVPDFARCDHDDLYRVVDKYLKAHPEIEKSARKRLCRVLDCKKLSAQTCVHAAQNEMLPLRVVVQVLFCEQQARAASPASKVAALPDDINSLVMKSNPQNDGRPEVNMQRLQCAACEIETLSAKLRQDEDDMDEYMSHRSFTGTGLSAFRSFCAVPAKPKNILHKFLSINK